MAKRTRRLRAGPTLIQRSRRVSPAEKAAYHQETGAGRSHVKRQFFGLSDADEELIRVRLQQRIDELLSRQGV